MLIGGMASNARPALERLLTHQHTITAVPDVRRVDDYATELAAADVLCGWPLNDALARRCPNVRLLQSTGIGVDGLDMAALAPGVMVANTAHHEAAIAEYVVMMMLMLGRRPHQYDARLRGGDWEGSCVWGETPVLRQLNGARALLLGVGRIARETAARLAPFGVHVTGVSRTPRAAAGFAEVIGWERWESELSQVDFLIPTCPLTPETDGLIGERQLAQMKAAAYLINISRGRVVAEEPLYRALVERRIAGAAIDVWYQYPQDVEERCAPSRFAFHELDNVILSPHNSGWTDYTIETRIQDIAANLNALADGRPLINVLRR